MLDNYIYMYIWKKKIGEREKINIGVVEYLYTRKHKRGRYTRVYCEHRLGASKKYKSESSGKLFKS